MKHEEKQFKKLEQKEQQIKQVMDKAKDRSDKIKEARMVK